jgi:hypothetical protein
MRLRFALLVALCGCATSHTAGVSVPAVDLGPGPYPAGDLCVFPQSELEERLRAQYAAWATIYKLTAVEQECLAGRKSFEQQIRSYRRACESEEPGSADAVVESALHRCYVEPNP